MLNGLGRYQMQGGRFISRASINPGVSPRRIGISSLKEKANLPDNTQTFSFAKPTGISVNAGLLSDSVLEHVRLAREMFDNDPVAGAVVETVAGIPFGNFSLSGMPDKEHLRPYAKSMDRMRVKSFLPTLAMSFMVDGAFLGTGVFDEREKVYDAIMPQDLLYATIYPMPFFGATPIVDMTVPPEIARLFSYDARDPRFASYYKFLPDEFKRAGLVKLQPENTFYIPRRGLAHNPLGTSLYRKIMITYILEKALTRGTIEMAYRRIRPILHLLIGDENWDASIEEMQEIAKMFATADLDPLGAVVATRQGVQPQEISGGGDFWKWTDNVDILTSIKLKGLGMPDGLLGGDMSLDSVSATLTIFINMIRSFRDYLTRAFFYEKAFAYISITNNHRRDLIGDFQETGQFTSRFKNSFIYHNAYVERANDVDVDMADYAFPNVEWHSSMRPEGDKEYLDLLMTLQQAGVPISMRQLAAAGGQDIHDLLNGADDDVEVRTKVAQYREAIQQTSGEDQQGGGGGEYGSFDPYSELLPLKRKGLAKREFDDNLRPRTNINGHSYVTTARERNRVDEKNNRLVAQSMSEIAKRMNSRFGTREGTLRQRVPVNGEYLESALTS